MSISRTNIILLIVSCLWLGIVISQEVCNEVVTWRNNNQTCPDRAVCADIFESLKEFQDGTQCLEKRTSHNCICPGGAVCPLDSPAHVLYASAIQKQIICRPSCNLPYCSNIKSLEAAAQTTVHNSPAFAGKTFNRINCRCPGHHVPFGQQRSVQASPQRFGGNRNMIEYVCSMQNNENLLGDPCEEK